MYSRECIQMYLHLIDTYSIFCIYIVIFQLHLLVRAMKKLKKKPSSSAIAALQLHSVYSIDN